MLSATIGKVGLCSLQCSFCIRYAYCLLNILRLDESTAHNLRKRIVPMQSSTAVPPVFTFNLIGYKKRSWVFERLTVSSVNAIFLPFVPVSLKVQYLLCY